MATTFKRRHPTSVIRLLATAFRASRCCLTHFSRNALYIEGSSFLKVVPELNPWNWKRARISTHGLRDCRPQQDAPLWASQGAAPPSSGSGLSAPSVRPSLGVAGGRSISSALDCRLQRHSGLSPVWFLSKNRQNKRCGVHLATRRPLGAFTRLIFSKTNKTHGAGCTSQHAGHSGLSPVWFF